ncbi:MAG: PAS domain S-box protein [candidate division Zixibacteria bacterium]|nr:PAS domain S-box protein [candidate division Zixibacteria bacterium]
MDYKDIRILIYDISVGAFSRINSVKNSGANSGYSITTVNSFNEMKWLVSRIRFDLVVVDIDSLPEKKEESFTQILNLVSPRKLLAIDSSTNPLGRELRKNHGNYMITTGSQLNFDELTAQLKKEVNTLTPSQLLKEKDRALETAEESFRRLIDSGSDAMIVVDGSGIIQFANVAAEKLYGRSASELLGEVFGFPLTGGESTEIDIITSAGESVVADMRATEIEWRGEKAFLASLRDISDKKKTEEMLKATLENLKRSNSDLQSFAYVASHDLQEPLRMVSSYCQLLAKKYHGKLDEDADKFITFAVQGANRMQRLITDLLEYSRIRISGKTFQWIEGEEIVKRALGNIQQLLHDKKARVTFTELPLLWGDRIQLTSLFQNIIANGIKFNQSPEPRIDIRVEKESQRWRFEIEDNGIGIEPKYKDKIFELFQQLQPWSEYGGTGMGLAIAKKIIERHNGEIWVDSQPGKGSLFIFTLPAVPNPNNRLQKETIGNPAAI